MDPTVDVLSLQGHISHYTNNFPSQVLNGILMTLQNKLLHHTKICQCHCNTSVRFCILNVSVELMCQTLRQQPVQRNRGTATFRGNPVEGNETLRYVLKWLLRSLPLPFSPFLFFSLPTYFYLHLFTFLPPSPLVGKTTSFTLMHCFTSR